MLLKAVGVFVGHMEQRERAVRLERTSCPRTARAVHTLNRSFNPELDFLAGREPDLSRKLLMATNGTIAYRLHELADARLREEVARLSCQGYAHLVDAMLRCMREAIGARASPAGSDCARARAVAPIAHGWKHGASMFMLPVYEAMFGTRFFFVHVVRDGRDMVLSLNRVTAKRYRHLCGVGSRPAPVGGCRKTRPSAARGASGLVGNPKAQLQVWALSNLGVTALARAHLGSRYVLVRSEDFIVGERPARVAALRRFLGQLQLRADAPLDELVRVFEHRIGFANMRGSFNGTRGNASAPYSGKWRPVIGRPCLAELLALPLVCDALHEYGYLARAECARQAADAEPLGRAQQRLVARSIGGFGSAGAAIRGSRVE